MGADELLVRGDVARPGGERLRQEKGINVPDTEVPVAALSGDDRHLAFVAEHADAVGLSFVRSAEDVDELYQVLVELGRADLRLVLKIETRQGFEHTTGAADRRDALPARPLTKRGQPTRAEVTDAAMGVRAECVMLNKGPYLVEAGRVLDDILTRMQAHQHKKRSLMRRLRAWTP